MDLVNVADRVEIEEFNTFTKNAFQSSVNALEIEVYEHLQNNVQDFLHYSHDLSGADLTG